MLELKSDALVFSFPEIHRNAVLTVEFHRTLRLPDDDRTYPLPPGLGTFPIRHVDDHAERVPARWREHGGVLLPMYQAEAMWLSFSSPHEYPFAVKVAAGKVNAVTGEEWTDLLVKRPEQNYMVVPEQPWLDGYVVEKGVVRQFVAMPLRSGYTVEEQVTGKAEHGGLQIQVFPLRREHYSEPSREGKYGKAAGLGPMEDASCLEEAEMAYDLCAPAMPDMGLAAGGSMRQDIYRDRRPFRHWNTAVSSRCFVHLVNALIWRQITEEEPPGTPATAQEYARHGLPWFDYYAADQEALEGGASLQGIRSIAQLAADKDEAPLPENQSVEVDVVEQVGPAKKSPDEVREGVF